MGVPSLSTRRSVASIWEKHMSVYIKMFLLGAVVLLASGVCAAQGPKPDAAAPRAAAGKRGYLGVALNGNQVLPVAPVRPRKRPAWKAVIASR